MLTFLAGSATAVMDADDSMKRAEQCMEAATPDSIREVVSLLEGVTPAPRAAASR